MGDEGTASSLIYAGAIIQLIFVVIFFGLAGFIFALLAPFMFDPFIAEYFWIITLSISLVFIILGIIDLIFVLLWFNWRHEPGQHKVGLIVTGIIGLLFTGFIPGLLVLIGGAIAPEHDKIITGVPSWTPAPAKGLRYCSVCGTQIEPGDRYCPKCGASLPS